MAYFQHAEAHAARENFFSSVTQHRQCGVSQHRQETHLHNRPDTLTQTFFTINFSLAVGRRTIHIGKFIRQTALKGECPTCRLHGHVTYWHLSLSELAISNTYRSGQMGCRR